MSLHYLLSTGSVLPLLCIASIVDKLSYECDETEFPSTRYHVMRDKK